MTSSEFNDVAQLFAAGVIIAILLWPSRSAPTPPRPGCQFCGAPVSLSLGYAACTECQGRARRHRQLLEQQTRLEIQLLERQLKQGSTNQEQGTP